MNKLSYFILMPFIRLVGFGKSIVGIRIEKLDFCSIKRDLLKIVLLAISSIMWNYLNSPYK